MKKIISLALAACTLLGALSISAFAAPNSRSTIGSSGTSGSVVVGSSGGSEVELHGSVEPTILSVIVPSYIPFSISRSQASSNKVVSPRIEVTNQSSVPVGVYVDNAKIDLSLLGGTTWSTDGDVSSREIAVGFVNSPVPPTGLTGAKWLANGRQHTELCSLEPSLKDNLYLVGTLGANVPESRGFTVVATLIVHAEA